MIPQYQLPMLNRLLLNCNIEILLLIFFCANTVAQENHTPLSDSDPKIVSLQRINNIQNTAFHIDSFQSQKHSVENVCGQALVGSLCAVGFSFLPYSATMSNLGSNDQVSAASVILTLTAYTFGAAVGVHWIAQSENPELSFRGTFGFSVIGAAVGSGLVAIFTSGNDTPFYGGVVLAALFPIISSIIYTSSIANWPTENQSISLPKNSLSHKDLIQYSKIFNVELFRFNF